MKVTSSECTVVMATYNGEKYLTEQLESLEQQTAPPARLIISDDGSSDATREILASYAKKATLDVMIVDGPQQGYAENFWSAAGLAGDRGGRAATAGRAARHLRRLAAGRLGELHVGQVVAHLLRVEVVVGVGV